MSLTVACVWVNGHVPFTADYVVKLYSMVRRHLSRPFRFVCLTDRGYELPESIQTIPIHLPYRMKGWWSKIELFNAAHHWKGRVLYLDLDTLIVSALDDVVDFPAPFALAPHTGTFNGRDGLLVVKRFNSSVMVWDAGTQDYLYHKWTPQVTRRLWGDQDYIGEQSKHAVPMPLEWFPRLSQVQWPHVPVEAKVVLCKKPKNTDAAKTLSGFAEAWQ